MEKYIFGVYKFYPTIFGVNLYDSNKKKYTLKIHTKNGWLKWLDKMVTPKLVDTPKQILC
jgi:hypothetical protein